MNRDDIIDVLTLISAYDHRTVGAADVIAWQNAIGDLPRDRALEAVTEFRREQPGEWLEAGHIYQRVRAKIRDELAREPDEFREARQAYLEAKAKKDDPLPPFEGPVKHRRPMCNWMSVRCPHCGAGPLKHCFVPGTTVRPHGGTHPAREDAAHKAAQLRDDAVESSTRR